MLNTQKTINAEKYNEWVRKFSEQIFKIKIIAGGMLIQLMLQMKL